MKISETNSINRPRSLEGFSDKAGSNRQEVDKNKLQQNQVNKNQLAPEKMREDLKEGELSKENLEKAIDELEEMSKFIDKGFDFHIHEKTERIWVEVIDKHNDEVVREIPPEQILDIVAGLKEVVGLIVDEEL